MMLDIHCHILPGVDDGPKNWTEALEMAHIAYEDGIRKIVATPHFIKGSYEPPVQEVLSLTAELNRRIQEAGLSLEILPGMEVYLEPELPELVKSQEVLTYNNERKYILLEFPPESIPPHSERIFYELRLQGVMPILAHAERNQAIMTSPQRLLPFVEKGLLTQVTGASLQGHFGSKCQEVAKILLKHNLAHFIASDAHYLPNRMPKLKAAYAGVQEVIPAAYQLLKQYEQSFDRGKFIVPEDPLQFATRKKSLFAKLFKR